MFHSFDEQFIPVLIMYFLYQVQNWTFERVCRIIPRLAVNPTIPLEKKTWLPFSYLADRIFRDASSWVYLCPFLKNLLLTLFLSKPSPLYFSWCLFLGISMPFFQKSFAYPLSFQSPALYDIVFFYFHNFKVTCIQRLNVILGIYTLKKRKHFKKYISIWTSLVILSNPVKPKWLLKRSDHIQCTNHNLMYIFFFWKLKTAPKN